MSVLITALRAELYKYRHTLAPWMVLLAPALIVLLATLQIGLSHMHGPAKWSAGDAWFRFSNGMFVLWGLLMLPLFVTLQAAWIGSVDHATQQWKHLLALPLPRWSHYAAKLLLLAGMVFAATALLALLTPLGGWVVMHIQPDYRLAGPPPWSLLAWHALGAACAAGLMTALQFWVALRWQSFTLAIGVGIGATVAGFLIGQSPRYGPLYPWSMALQAAAGHGERIPDAIAVGLAGLLLVGTLAVWRLARRECP